MKYLAEALDNIDLTWRNFLMSNLSAELNSINHELEFTSKTQIIYPPKENIFRALKYPAHEQKVVVLGQDPYHGENQANGLAFAVNQDIALPPSLRNIYKELLTEFPKSTNATFDRTLEQWLEQRVILLNATLTVIKDNANSMAKIGWDKVTDAIIQYISNESPNCVFMLWGNFARSKAPLIDCSKHLILESVHPSPLSASRGFLGCNHFILANEYLSKHNLPKINWL